MPATDPGTHVTPASADAPDGVYRVVGAREDAVTLLRVGDADGRRVHTGELHAVSESAFAGFEPAPNPDGNRPLRTALTTRLSLPYWSLRAVLAQLSAHPIPAAVASAFVLAGAFGGRFVPLPDAAFGLSVLLGSLALASVGSGRFP